MANEDGGSNLAWFLAGAALGATAALLLAPQTGDEARDLVRRKAEEGREVLTKSGREAYDRGREYYEKGRGLAEDAAKVFKKEKTAAAEGEPAEVT